jgi:hypothetical protein
VWILKPVTHVSFQEAANHRRNTNDVFLASIIGVFTLATNDSILKGVLTGSPALQGASQKAGKWSLQALVRLFECAIRGNEERNPPRQSPIFLLYPGRALVSLPRRCLFLLKLVLRSPVAEPFESGGALWNPS